MNTNKWIGVSLAIVLIGISHGLSAAQMYENTLDERKILSQSIIAGNNAKNNLFAQNKSLKKTVRFVDQPDTFKNNSSIVSPKKKKRTTKKVVQSQQARTLSFWYCWACRCS